MYASLNASASASASSILTPSASLKDDEIPAFNISSIKNNSDTEPFLGSDSNVNPNKTLAPKILFSKNETELRRLERLPVEYILTKEAWLREILPKRGAQLLNMWAGYLLAKIDVYQKTGFDIGEKKLHEMITLSSAEIDEIVEKRGIGLSGKQYCKLRATFEDPFAILKKHKILPYLNLTADRIRIEAGYDNPGFLGEEAIDEAVSR